MMRRVEENWTDRYHLYVDGDAKQLNAIVIKVSSAQSPCAVFAQPNEDQQQLLDSAVATLRALRSWTPNLIHPGCAHPPFASLTVTSRHRCVDDVDLLVQWMLAEGSHDHMERVQSLCKLYDLYERQLADATDAPSAVRAAH